MILSVIESACFTTAVRMSLSNPDYNFKPAFDSHLRSRYGGARQAQADNFYNLLT